MLKFLVSGLINVETNLKIDKFPLQYYPVNYDFFGITTAVSGVGYNVSKALNKLGGNVELLSIIGNDINSDLIYNTFKHNGLNIEYLMKIIDQTPQSVILYDKYGNRQIHVDLKNIQEVSYPTNIFLDRLKYCDIAVLCNINFSRPFLKVAKKLGKIIATDVHVISDIYDDYNAEFMENANILFMSDENIGDNVEDFVKKVVKTYNNDILVVGMGSRGALLYVKKDNYVGRFSAIHHIDKVVNTVGAGDALFSSFIFYYTKTKDPYTSIKKAILFASYKIRKNSGSDGFLSEIELNKLGDG